MRLRGARLTGEPDLDAMTITCPLALHQCVFDGAVRLTETEAKSISLRGSRLTHLSANDLRTSGVLDLAKIEVAYFVALTGARVGRDRYLIGARLGRIDKTALLATGLEVGGHLRAAELTAEGALVLTDATIGGHFDLGRATVRNAGDRALTADKLQVGTFLRGAGFPRPGRSSSVGPGSARSSVSTVLNCPIRTVSRSRPTGFPKSWYPQGAAQVWSWVFTGAGRVLTTAVVAGLTHALKRD